MYLKSNRPRLCTDPACYLRFISALCDVDRAYVNLCAQSTVTLHRLIMSSLADIFSFIAIIDIRIVWAYDSMNIIAFYLHDSWFISFLYIYCQWFNHSFIMLLSIYMKIHFLEEYLSSFILSKVTIDYNSTCLFVANYTQHSDIDILAQSWRETVCRLWWEAFGLREWDSLTTPPVFMLALE